MNRIDYSIARVDSVLPADWRRPDTASRQDSRQSQNWQEKRVRVLSASCEFELKEVSNGFEFEW